jgi:PAS domain S-box-containing protein
MPDDATEDTELTLLSREELESQVRDRTADLRNVMDTMADVLLKLDADGHVTMTNDAVPSVLGYEPETVVGKPVDYLFADADNEALSAMLTRGELVERLLSAGQVTDVEVYFETEHGDVVPMSLSASVMREDGAVTGIVCVAKDISERKVAEEKAQFLHSLLRHDLGNKLQVTSGYLDMLADPDMPSEDAFLEDARTGVAEAVELIEDVRTLNEVEATTDASAVELEPHVAGAVDRHADLARDEGVTVTADVPAGVEVVGGRLLKELFGNLVENALVHADATEVHLAATVESDAVVVTQTDDGVGIPADERDAVFEKGYQIGSSSGSGLGMYLVDRIAAGYDGTVTVGAADAGGARFDVTLRRA